RPTPRGDRRFVKPNTPSREPPVRALWQSASRAVKGAPRTSLGREAAGDARAESGYAFLPDPDANRDANAEPHRRSLIDESRARPERGAARRGDEPARIRLCVAARGREEGRRRGRERRPVGRRGEVCPERVL